jgi:uncharacterized protein YyaL (SSP411 family)
LTNRLAAATSPYLRQHAENPVEWYPWGEEALQRARREEKPILLSIGYAACHWCHVMAHESFQDPEVARLMNELFVNVKVDREERPDLDSIYMLAVQAMTGQGGWPLTVFLAPDGTPFYGGTYFPPQDRAGLPSFKRLLQAVARAWNERREAVLQNAARVRQYLQAATLELPAPTSVGTDTIDRAARSLAVAYDSRHGGFGGAPKFPPTMALDFLLRHWARTGRPESLDMVRYTFQAMARGGIYDQLGGGLHRYSVDERWLVPHFEKMLYDSALFARLGVHLWQVTKDPEIQRVVRDTLDWMLREMRAPEGGFYSSLDADSEGVEGKYYLWTWEDFEQLPAEDAELARTHWGVTREGNFEGCSILHVPHGVEATAARLGRSTHEVEARLRELRARLLAWRSQRTPPATDDKIVAAWNGLAVRALCEAARAFADSTLQQAALSAGDFLRRQLLSGSRLARCFAGGKASGTGLLEDYASLGLAFLDLYTLTFDSSWYGTACELAEAILALFHEQAADAPGRFYDTPHDHEALIVRPRDLTDNATPSGSSLAAELLARLAELSGDERWARPASQAVEAVGEALARHPLAFGHLLGVADLLVHGTIQVVLAGTPGEGRFERLARSVHETYVPALVMAGGKAEAGTRVPAILAGRTTVEEMPVIYVCHHHLCEMPVSDAEQVTGVLRRAATAQR